MRFSSSSSVNGQAELATHSITKGESIAPPYTHVESVSALAAEGPVSSPGSTWSGSNSDIASCNECNPGLIKHQPHKSLLIPSFVSLTRKRSIERRKQIEKRTGEWDLKELVVDHVDKIRRELAAGTLPDYAGAVDGNDNDDSKSESGSYRFTTGFTKSSTKSDAKSIRSSKDDGEEGLPLADMSEKASSKTSTRDGSIDLSRNDVSFVGHAHRGSIGVGPSSDVASTCHRHHGHAQRASLDLSRRSLDVQSTPQTASPAPFTPGHVQRASIDMGAFTRGTSSYPPTAPNRSGLNKIEETWRGTSDYVRGIGTDTNIDVLIASVSTPLTSLKTCQMEVL
ncbi:hypothetical protein SeMB42_g03186 [Synchytrium endobioticum]|uniref:Uncharacterized protein n=1 Tax=Synchytrium endobioticum TaxID=286115 RepID=A0A507CY10_9FUNG|nr:hypothetical protein SeLEV6574_g04737 [Synchytrium endobioticum]TPX47843.1 hypothetical protein SeMB42_g03186 [Synchytrium endobioticum]